jgi:signal transduction histidine kinase
MSKEHATPSVEAEQPAALPAEQLHDRAQRLAAMGQLAGGILHEFNNILTVVSGTIDILAQAASGRPELAAIVRLIDDAAMRGSRLTTRFQSFERGNAPRYREIDVEALLADAVRLLRPLLEGHADVNSSTAAKVPLAFADPGLLLTGLLSLAISARDVMHEGGMISLEARSGSANGDEQVVVLFDAISHAPMDDAMDRMADALDMIERWIGQSGGEIRPGHQTDRSLSIEIRLQAAPDDAS